ncbi:hypothetical protein TIFTF001_048586 [Ficus carica]|uniref:Uncharacterized protein n=1 Tax=Ficus carica TaxID=3494 RepID=A0AA88CIX2_FICCA|nr:hypothetical protein TIFTF001_048575 [Ficus carica]GMN19124.1 hypothetical protein TIFTF001_048580 [Ficus carica]GMN19135.1 hypothetical protein TIFTF001_048581 [Ficus carica]GMN19158.1 hypothetical protein TIFTF001_048586 [Ficus carica]
MKKKNRKSQKNLLENEEEAAPGSLILTTKDADERMLDKGEQYSGSTKKKEFRRTNRKSRNLLENEEEAAAAGSLILTTRDADERRRRRSTRARRRRRKKKFSTHSQFRRSHFGKFFENE